VHDVGGVVVVHGELLEHHLALGLDVVAAHQAVEHLVHHDVHRERQVVVEHAGVEARVLAPGEGVRLATDRVELLGDLQRVAA
jgi:hypothetical protein